MEVRFVDSELETVIDRVIKYFTEINGIQAAYLFGSFATNRVTAESDIDLAILTNVALDEELLFQIQDTLEGLVGREVDLIDLRNCSPILAYQVLKYGKRILLRDEHALNLWIIQVMNAYYDLKIDRRPIERSILERSHSRGVSI